MRLNVNIVKVTDCFATSAMRGQEIYGELCANGDVLDMRLCDVVSTGFICGLYRATADKQLTVQVSSGIHAEMFKSMKEVLFPTWGIEIIHD